jgi:large subunit ribosomal protein L18
MITQTNRDEIRQRIHVRIRRKLAGTAERPRLSVHRSLTNIYAQVIDDQKG